MKNKILRDAALRHGDSKVLRRAEAQLRRFVYPKVLAYVIYARDGYGNAAKGYAAIAMRCAQSWCARYAGGTYYAGCAIDECLEITRRVIVFDKKEYEKKIFDDSGEENANK